VLWYVPLQPIATGGLFDYSTVPTPATSFFLRLSITSLHVFKIKKMSQKQYPMVGAVTDAPAPRKRGRPRVTDNQQCPEVHPEQLQCKLELTQGIQRRRKQLRVAQQSYRKRKDTTIVNLQSRVQKLESGIEEISESFLSFSDLLLEAGILQNQPRVTAALQQITQQCVSLAKSGCDEAEQAPAADVSRSTSPTLRDTQDLISNQFDSWPMIGDAFQSSSDIVAQWPGLSQLPSKPPFQEQAILPSGIVSSSPNIPFLSIPSPTLNFPTIPVVSPDSLLSQGRWTLSHRLVRQCCETGYYLLTRSSADDPRVKAVFGKRLTIDERDRFIFGFFANMHDEMGDTVELSTKVLSSRRSSYSPEELTVSSRTWQTVQESGADEWMDASGVQRLLQQRGILSSPQVNSAPQLNAASFTKCE
jgi:hypothetical protein